MSDSEFAQYAFGGQGVKGERSSPCKQPVPRERDCQPKADKGLACLDRSFWKASGTYGGKNWERRRPFFYVICPSCVQKLLSNFFDSTLVSDKKKFKPKSLKAGSAFNQSARTDKTYWIKKISYWMSHLKISADCVYKIVRHCMSDKRNFMRKTVHLFC